MDTSRRKKRDKGIQLLGGGGCLTILQDRMSWDYTFVKMLQVLVHCGCSAEMSFQNCTERFFFLDVTIYSLPCKLDAHHKSSCSWRTLLISLHIWVWWVQIWLIPWTEGHYYMWGERVERQLPSAPTQTLMSCENSVGVAWNWWVTQGDIQSQRSHSMKTCLSIRYLHTSTVSTNSLWSSGLWTRETNQDWFDWVNWSAEGWGP